MIDTANIADFKQIARAEKRATTTIAEKHMIELNWLVEELQDEIDTFDSGRCSHIHACLIANLTTAIVKRTLLLRQTVRQITGQQPPLL